MKIIAIPFNHNYDPPVKEMICLQKIIVRCSLVT